jgi:Nif-specific regulatory protein
MEKMTAYDWPGNVRELQNALERAVVMGRGGKIEPEDLPMFASRSPAAEGIEVGMSLEEAMHAFKKKFIRMNLEKTGGNQTRAAKIMGIQRTYLSRLISRYGIKKDQKDRWSRSG